VTADIIPPGPRLADLVGADLVDVDAPAPSPDRSTGIDLSPQQEEARDKVFDWYRSDEQVFRLFGYAGTGKTTIARYIVDQLGVAQVLFGAFTGKAAYVLRTKGCEGASTLHSMIYQPKEKVRAHLHQLQAELVVETDPEKQLLLQRAIYLEERKLDSPDWLLRDPDECELSTASLLVIDEVSMVNGTMAADLLGFGCKTLVLGDPAQLPPVEGGGYFINAEPDHLLTEIHRSALDSPVTRLATAVRGAANGDRLYGVHGADGDSGRRSRLTRGELLDFDQILVGTNRSRWTMIHLLRALRGLTGAAPAPGDRIIALANSSDAEVFNGQQFDVAERSPHPKRDDQLRLQVVDDEGKARQLDVWAAGFTDIEGERKAKRDGRGSVVAATFAQAITCHKSQGSQWNNVLVLDESAVFAAMSFKESVRTVGATEAGVAAHRTGCQWLYTAVTRAAERVVIVPQIGGLIS
jgi:exodeoxyribonuclease-5